MFETLSHLALQQYWWIIVSLLGAILVFLMFVQGGQTLLYSIGKSEDERSLLVNALGRKWEFTFTTLVTFGGAFFASFPLFYSTSFGGAYWVWMIILFAFVIQAVSYEYRSKPNNVFGARTFELFLFLNGALGTILIGTAVATFFTGSAFSVNEMNFSKWEGPAGGLEAALSFHNLSLGLAVFFLARTLGILYFINHIDHPGILEKSRNQLLYNAIPFVVFFLTFVIWLMFIDGYAVDPQSEQVSLESGKYLTNLIEMPLVLILFLLGVIAVLYGIFIGWMKKSSQGIWFSGIGTVVTVLMLFLIAGFNNTAFYPSSSNIQSSLTIQNASSSHFTLKAMTYVSLMVPFVIAYIWYAWKSINNKKLDMDELNGEDHIY